MTTYLTTEQVAEALLVTRQTVITWVHKGKFPGAVRLKSKNIIIPEEDVEQMKPSRLEELEEEVAKSIAMLEKMRASIP